MNEREQILVLSAMLHDIGKFVQRASSDFNKKKHEVFGKEFLEQNLNVDPKIKKEVLNLVLSHHEINYEGKYKDLLDILKQADGESAEHDRKELGDIDERINQSPLLSVYSHISIGRQVSDDVYYKLSPLDKKLNYPDKDVKNNQKIYEALYKDFKNEFAELTIKDKGDINTLLFILLKYTKYIPSAIYRSMPDIPLYDHLKTTAAIALCKLRSDSNNKYTLIMGDLSGIQNYIFHNQKGGESQVVDEHATKRMRGRSFLVNLIVDSAVQYIIHELDLYEFNVLWESGGTFLILAPTQDDIDRHLAEIRRNINRYLLVNFGRLYLNLAWIKRDKISEFGKILEELHGEMDEVKSRRYIDFVRDEKFYVNEKSGEYICPVCGVQFVEAPDERCQVCKKTERIGDKLGKARYLLRIIDDKGDNKGDFSFEYGDFHLSYTLVTLSKDDLMRKSEVFSIDDFKLPKIGAMRGFRILKTHLPAARGNILTISDIVSMADRLEDRIGENQALKGKLAIFKADVDCLGEIFARGLESAGRVTISLISTLSFLMDLFFTQEINNIAREHNVYVVFSGGDDLTVLGRYDEVMNFALEVYDKFSRWSGGNNNIHISGAIVMFNEKFPIRRGVEIAEEELERAKNYRKIDRCVEKGNMISIFGHVLPWNEFKNQIKMGNELWNAQRDEIIPASLSHVLLALHRLSPEFYATQLISKGAFVIPSPKPYLRYYFARRRSAKSDEILKMLVEENTFRYIPVGVSIWVMNRKYKKEVRKNE